MSYILNALRKSERERQAIQPDTVTSRIAIQHAPERQSLTKIIAVLVILNLAILIYFLGIAPHIPEDGEQTPAKIEKPAPLIANPPPLAADQSSPAKFAPNPKIQPPRNQAQATDNIAAGRKQPVEPTKPAVTPPQPVKPPAVVAKPVLDTKPAAEPEQQTITVPQIVAGSEQPTAKKPEPVATTRPHNDLPTLEDLPPDVRQSLPTLPINVFSYSSTPAERFVMIDMVKYVPGQTIKNALELKEITEDGIIVRYEGRVFKIKR
jgi:general secretion pathway protein B